MLDSNRLYVCGVVCCVRYNMFYTAFELMESKELEWERVDLKYALQ